MSKHISSFFRDFRVYVHYSRSILTVISFFVFYNDIKKKIKLPLPFSFCFQTFHIGCSSLVKNMLCNLFSFVLVNLFFFFLFECGMNWRGCVVLETYSKIKIMWRLGFFPAEKHCPLTEHVSMAKITAPPDETIQVTRY